MAEQKLAKFKIDRLRKLSRPPGYVEGYLRCAIPELSDDTTIVVDENSDCFRKLALQFKKAPDRSRGLGDTVAKIIDKAAAMVGTHVHFCNTCNGEGGRQEKLNKLVPYPKDSGAGRTPDKFFDRIVFLNLKRRPDRLRSFRAGVKSCGWPFQKPERFEAVDGHVVPAPRSWNHGDGTWGCMQSHRQILERAIMDGVQSLLILEDDVVLRSSFGKDITAFLAKVPAEWDQLMIGGQLFPNSEIKEIGPGIARVSNCQRTHAYAVRGKFIKTLYQHWVSTVGHCDHRMGEIQHRYRVYAPVPFIAGQAASASDISGANNPIQFWNPPADTDPVVVLKCPAAVAVELRKHGFHFGNTLLEDGSDLGLREIFGPQPIWDTDRHLGKWIEMIAWEAASLENGICTVFHPQVDTDLVRKSTKRTVFELEGKTVDAILQKWGQAR